MKRIVVGVLLLTLFGCNRHLCCNAGRYELEERWNTADGRRIVLEFLNDSVCSMTMEYRNKKIEYDRSPLIRKYSVLHEDGVKKVILHHDGCIEAWGKADTTGAHVVDRFLIPYGNTSDIYKGISIPANDTLICHDFPGAKSVVWSGMRVIFQTKINKGKMRKYLDSNPDRLPFPRPHREKEIETDKKNE